MHDLTKENCRLKVISSIGLILIIIFIYQWYARHHLPFFEADGYVDTMAGEAVVRWLSNDKIIYGVNSNERKDSFPVVNRQHLELSKQINIFDIKKQKTYLYKRGQLLEYKNGQILIRLSLGEYDSINNLDISKPQYLYGILGAETRKEYQISPRYLDKCPSDTTDSKPYYAWLLGSEYPNACLRLPDLYDKDRRWIYYPANGNTIELTKSSEFFVPNFIWINWMQAYLLEKRSSSINTIKILYPDGKFKSINIDEKVSHAKPTKVGVVGAINDKSWISNGLRLFHEGSTYKITTGRVSHTEVSPDGCQVAYITNSKLRIINVCKFNYS
ncbi:MAG: hypothetical protein EOO44_21165 [Flavobacterium sp.]|nr:MAG: hypothetical protein EOO44_21165 [Flavobacterium sp.]